MLIDVLFTQRYTRTLLLHLFAFSFTIDVLIFFGLKFIVHTYAHAQQRTATYLRTFFWGEGRRGGGIEDSAIYLKKKKKERKRSSPPMFPSITSSSLL